MADNVNNWGLFLQTTVDVDVAQVQQANVNSPEFKELLVRLYQSVSDIQRAVNLKDTGYYLTKEFNTSQLLFNVNNDFNNIRAIFRTTVNFGALPNFATKQVAHGINWTNTYTLVKIYGAATDTATSEGITLPYSNPSADISMDNTFVYVTTFADFSNYNISYITLEYVKN